MNNNRRKVIARVISNLESWQDELSGERFEALPDFSCYPDELERIVNTVESVTDDEQEAYDNLPDGIRDSDRGMAMEDALDNLTDALNELEDVQGRLADFVNQDTDETIDDILSDIEDGISSILDSLEMASD